MKSEQLQEPGTLVATKLTEMPLIVKDFGTQEGKDSRRWENGLGMSMKVK